MRFPFWSATIAALVPAAVTVVAFAAPPVDATGDGASAPIGTRPRPASKDAGPPSATDSGAAPDAPVPSSTGTGKPPSTPPSAGVDPKTVVIDGTFKLAGRGDDGAKYTGTLTLVRATGQLYTAKWVIGANTFSGTIYRDEELLSAGWAAKAADANLVTYLVRTDDLAGVLSKAVDKGVGSETLKPVVGAVPADLAGKYQVAGKNADGSKYSGTAAVKKLGSNAWSFDWVLGGAKIGGLGLRTRIGTRDVVAVAYPDASKSFGALQYVIGRDKTLTGSWVQSIAGKVTTGTETASP
jgi:hypothetical protein